MARTVRFLQAYDDQLRTDAETPSALSVTHHGPLRLVTFGGGRGFVTYRHLGDATAHDIRDMVSAALDQYRSDPTIERVEWKTRGHDHAPGLHEALIHNGFVPQPRESIMIGTAGDLAAQAQTPEGVALRRITDVDDVHGMAAMEKQVYPDDDVEATAAALLHRMSIDAEMELWVAEAAGQVVATGRLEPVPGTDFAGIWGGTTLPGWRRRGIYRALVSARARSAIAKGKTLIHSDSTDDSRPILERSGMVAVSTTTPYHWHR